MKFGEWSARALQCAALAAGLLLSSGSGVAQPVDVKRGQTWPARVSFVVDGDSIWVLPEQGGRRAKLRLDGVDAPETCQIGGVASREALKKLVLGQSVNVTIRARDRYGRAIASVVRAEDGLDVALAMVRDGWAWNDRYGWRQGKYPQAEASARKARRGVFAQKNPETPAAFRKRHGPCVADGQGDALDGR
jgi:endonuclease YncB( thermonuclease family)